MRFFMALCRLLRRTIPGQDIGAPPTAAIAIIIQRRCPVTSRASVLLKSSLFAVTLALCANAAQAQQSVADFYKGKQMKFVIRSTTGGGYDIYSRLLAAHIVRHIPGNPTMLPQNMPGAGGLQAANFMADIAPKDGTHLTMVADALAMDQALGMSPAFTADMRKFGWVGNISDSNLLAYVWHTSPTKTMADAKTRETLMGGTGPASAPSWLPIVFNNVLGTKFKIVNGYKSSGEIKLAMERGEIEGYGANPLSALLSASPDLLRNKQVSILVQVGMEKEKELPDVPLLTELASNADDKAILEFVCKSFAVGRPIGTTPDAPPERLAALRKAFDDTMMDPLFLADAKKIGADIEPMNGATLQALIDDIVGAPQAIKDKVKAVMPDRG
jgi:tripartite-type tricarboxylate transporter receptor subunit TctC